MFFKDRKEKKEALQRAKEDVFESGVKREIEEALRIEEPAERAIALAEVDEGLRELYRNEASDIFWYEGEKKGNEIIDASPRFAFMQEQAQRLVNLEYQVVAEHVAEIAQSPSRKGMLGHDVLLKAYAAAATKYITEHEKAAQEQSKPAVEKPAAPEAAKPKPRPAARPKKEVYDYSDIMNIGRGGAKPGPKGA